MFIPLKKQKAKAKTKTKAERRPRFQKKPLTIELVPKSAWNDNLRKHLTDTRWDLLRKFIYAAFNNHCGICGGVGRKWPVECHEIWSYDEVKRIQKLEGLIALCPSCHEVKHIGRAQATGHYERALKHLMKVNKFTRDEAEKKIFEAREVWRQRSDEPWTLDLSFLYAYKEAFEKANKNQEKEEKEEKEKGEEADASL
jgi:5-methylcytosine-specific restriction endonuclease McrA